ncbi:MAG: hypothetical protein V4721_03350 [Bacteroidota bacterium]
MKKLTIALITILALSVSCKKENKDDTGSSRTLRYEVTGNFSGTLFASYTTASGGTANDQVPLPWTKEITYTSNVDAAIIALSGNGGTAGQKITLVIKRGDKQVNAPLEIVAQSTGSFSATAPVVVF